jgi:adenylate cyclase
MVVYLPVFCGKNHAEAAIRGARELLVASSHGLREQSLHIGIGVNSGVCYFGTVKGAEGTFADFTALGDPVNVAARLAGTAAAGEALIAEVTCEAAHLELEDCERRTLALKGKTEPTRVRCLRYAEEGALASTAPGR